MCVCEKERDREREVCENSVRGVCGISSVCVGYVCVCVYVMDVCVCEVCVCVCEGRGMYV